MVRFKNFVLFSSFFIIMISNVSAQIKIGYVLSERIRTEYEEFKEAEAQLQLELKECNQN